MINVFKLENTVYRLNFVFQYVSLEKEMINYFGKDIDELFFRLEKKQ